MVEERDEGSGMEAERQPEEDEPLIHAPEPWRQDGRYVRDAFGTIVVRGRSFGDARRIVAAVNATRGMPTEALEGWCAEDVSDPRTRPDLEVLLPEEAEARAELDPPPSEPPPSWPGEAGGSFAFEFERRVFQRRVTRGDVLLDRRKRERRRSDRDAG
jgi:hypothetical protein